MIKELAKMKAKNCDGTLEILIKGEIDHHSAKKLRENIDKTMFMYRPNTLVLSMSGVTFMDSSGLGLIVGRAATAESLDCRIRIVGADSKIIKILSMAGVDKIPHITIEKKETK